MTVQVRCMKQGTQSQCSGTTQRDRVGREVGGGFKVEGEHMYGTRVYLWPIQTDVWQKAS